LRRIALIAELQKHVRPDLNLVHLARIYAANGAAALAVPTDRNYLHGEPNDLKAARVGSDLPLLREDLIIDEYQLYESRALQADAITLSAEMLNDAQLRDYRALAESMGMGAVVEVDIEPQLMRVLESGPRIIVIPPTLAREEFLQRLPSDILTAYRGAIASRTEVERLASLGVNAVLVGGATLLGEGSGGRMRELFGNAKEFYRSDAAI
jgi:indole-3-glycerol phosphate synthase